MNKALGLAIALALVLAAPDVFAQEKPRMGGVLKVASIGEPPTLDLQATTTVLTYEIMWVFTTVVCPRRNVHDWTRDLDRRHAAMAR